MRKILFSIVTASALLSDGVAFAETTTSTTTTWTADDGTMIKEYSTTKKYAPISDPSMNAEVGAVLPGTVAVYPLPETMKVENPDRYSYTIINNKPMVVERSSRRVVHIW